MDKKDDIFKIKPLDGKNIVVEDKRKTISPFNSAKHFNKYCSEFVKWTELPFLKRFNVSKLK